METFAQPEDVTSPRMRWRLIRVLFKGDQSDPQKHDPEGYSVAVGMWDELPCLALRWNCYEDRPVGHPHSRGLPTWFIVPKELAEPILKTLPSDAESFARGIIQ